MIMITTAATMMMIRGATKAAAMGPVQVSKDESNNYGSPLSEVPL